MRALLTILLTVLLQLPFASCSSEPGVQTGGSTDANTAVSTGDAPTQQPDPDGLPPEGRVPVVDDTEPDDEPEASGGTTTGGTNAPEPGSAPEDSAPEDPEELPPALTEYMGRRIAQTMHWKGAEWLMRATREDEEHATEMLDALDVPPGATVADIGCGNGYHTLRLAARVGAEGRVLAVDIQEPMLAMLRRRMANADLTNVEPILGTLADPRLPEGVVDLVLLVDVYHEFSHPEQMLAAIRRSLAPGGRVVLVEFREEDPDVPIKPLHKMSKAQVRRELEANGFQHAASYDELPWQHVETFQAAR